MTLFRRVVQTATPQKYWFAQATCHSQNSLSHMGLFPIHLLAQKNYIFKSRFVQGGILENVPIHNDW